MARKYGHPRLGVDVCLESLDDPHTPHCPHGPTILFERFTIRNKSPEKYYACSTCRDRKDCNFYQRQGDKPTSDRKEARTAYNKLMQPPFTHIEHWKRKKKFDNLLVKNFCQSCGLLLMDTEWMLHKDHVTRSIHNTDELLQPSHLLAPLTNKKTNAQYLFSDKSVNFFISMLREVGCTGVLCVGTPRLHEALCCQSDLTNRLEASKSSSSVKQSLLLDIDHRYGQFYGPDKFARYNMFNHHFFETACGDDLLSSFFSGHSSDAVAMVMDPPFGGLVEVLAHKVKKIMALWSENQQKNKCEPQKDLAVFWIFPYFMEERIIKCLPEFVMLDYKVEYANHGAFKSREQKGSKHDSPVRIFTNVLPSEITLPQEEGYKWCSGCKKFVSEENKHCYKCKSCTSKDGRRYVHCEKCNRCVKPSRVHCDVCEECQLPDHICGNQGVMGCHICGEGDHKRRDCPDRFNRECRQKMKRKRDWGQKVEDSTNTEQKKSFKTNKKKMKNKKRLKLIA